MGLLDGVLGQVVSKVGGNDQMLKMAQAAIGMIGGAAGGSGGGGGGSALQGLVEKLQAGGLGDAAKSWIGTGDNADVSPDELRQAIGEDEIGKVAAEAGVSNDEAAHGLAALLPQIIDKVTPDGLVPDADALAKQLQKML